MKPRIGIFLVGLVAVGGSTCTKSEADAFRFLCEDAAEQQAVKEAPWKQKIEVAGSHMLAETGNEAVFRWVSGQTSAADGQPASTHAQLLRTEASKRGLSGCGLADQIEAQASLGTASKIDCSCCHLTGGAAPQSEDENLARTRGFNACKEAGGDCSAGCPTPPSSAPVRR